MNTILAAFGLTLEPWMAPLAALLIFALLMPLIVRGRKLKLARKRLQKASHESGEERRRLQQEALELVADTPMGLVGVAEEALRRNMRPLAREALERLQATGKARDMQRTLQRKIDGDRPTTAEGEAAAIERLLDSGLSGQARERYATASQRWPEAEALQELRGRVSQVN